MVYICILSHLYFTFSLLFNFLNFNFIKPAHRWMHKAVYKYVHVILLGDKYDELERDAHETEYEEV